MNSSVQLTEGCVVRCVPSSSLYRCPSIHYTRPAFLVAVFSAVASVVGKLKIKMSWQCEQIIIIILLFTHTRA